MAKDVLNIAHRGARSLAPENTILSARKAVAVGADMWEMDVALTADGQIVVLHDDTLERTSNAQEVFPGRAPWNVHEFTYDELLQLDFGAWFNDRDPFGQIAARAVTAQEQQNFGKTRIPTLREALEFTRDYRFRINIEIKDHTGTPGDISIVESVVDLVNQMNMVNRVLISSFNHDYIVRSKARNPEIPTGALIEAPVADPVALLKQTGANALNPDLALATDDLIGGVCEAGYDVYVWTVNEEADMRRLIQAGVSGIFTDYPQLLHRLLHQ